MNETNGYEGTCGECKRYHQVGDYTFCDLDNKPKFDWDTCEYGEPKDES